MGGVHDQHRGGLVVEKHPRIGLGQATQIICIDLAFIPDPAPGDAFEQHVFRRLQIDHQIGNRCIHREMIIDLLIEFQLIGIQGNLGEQAVLLHQKVSDADRLEQVCLAHGLHLAHTLKQKKKLCRQCTGTRVPVEALQERVLLSLLQQQLGLEAVRQPACKAGLANANRTFDNDVTGMILTHLPVMIFFREWLSH